MVNRENFSQTELLQRFFKMVSIMNSAPSIDTTAHHLFGVSLVFHSPYGKVEINTIRGSELVILYSFLTSLSQLPIVKCGLYRQCNNTHARL
jgi:hypothetical protein